MMTDGVTSEQRMYTGLYGLTDRNPGFHAQHMFVDAIKEVE